MNNLTQHTFQQRCVQDLAWVIQSPPLISGMIDNVDWWSADFFEHEYKACLPALHQLNADPTPLLNALNNAKSKRLGHYFESLLAYWFDISPNYELLLNNHQLRTPERTLGELDFLLHERASNKVIHLEVSVKFYLGTGDLNNMANWHGPGLKDRLDRKFQHLCVHQTQLACKFPKLMPYEIDKSACLMKGRLFYPAGNEAKTTFTANQHCHGYWYELPDLPDSEQRYSYLGKDHWLAEVQPACGEGEGEGEEPTLLPAQLDEATLYIERDLAQGNEQARFFILPEGFWSQS